MEFIRVRRGDSELIERVYSILAAAGAYMVETMGLMHWATPYSRERITEDTEGKQVYIVRSDDAFVATFTLSDKTTYAFRGTPDEGAAYLSKFAVAPGIMKSGIGSACIGYIESVCRREGKTKLRFDVYAKSEHAINFYVKMGYTEVASPDATIICMEKALK